MPEFLVPDLGEGLEEATIVRWHVAVGEPVALNQPLCTVETAKAEVDIPSPYEGTIVELGGASGETLSVGSLLARVDTGAEDAVRPEPTLVGYGHDRSLDRSRRSRAHTPGGAPTPPSDAPPGRALAKPPVRLLARRLGVDLAAISPGSGANGIVTRADVEMAATPGTSTASGHQGSTTMPVRGVRARVAEHLATSRREIPDATCGVVVDCSRLLAVRTLLDEHAARRGLAPVVTPFSLLARFVVQALRTNPLLNATYDAAGPAITVHEPVHLGIGTATDRGLVVTVVRDAHALSAHALAVELDRLTAGARAGSLSPRDLAGSTFTISNFGALGLDDGVPVINHPEAAILGVGSIKLRPHVVDDEVVARPTAHLTLAFDHRVFDGAEAGRFLGEVRHLVEAPELGLL